MLFSSANSDKFKQIVRKITTNQLLKINIISMGQFKMVLNDQIITDLRRHRPTNIKRSNSRRCRNFANLLCISCVLSLTYSSHPSGANQQRQEVGNKSGYRNQSATISQQQQQHQMQLHHGRPLDRPSLALVSNMTAQQHEGELPDGAADWFMMGGGDLMIDEGRNVASFADTESRSNKTMRRRMAEVRHRKHPKGSNKTIFDDEQSSTDATDTNEIFDDAEEGGSMAGTQKEPDCAAHGRYYCTFKEDYPLKLVTEVTKYYKWPLEKLFRDLHAQIMPKLAQDSTGNLVCDSITRVVRPGWARNTNDRWLVVINTDNYHQYVTEVVCQYGTNSRCNFIPPCYYSSCQQRYNTQKLLVIDPTNPYRGPFLSEFLFPSCCVCYVPSSSDTFKDTYRSSPATIYQRTMQQEAASNVHPPQFRSPQVNLLEEAFGSASNVGNGQAVAGAVASASSASVHSQAAAAAASAVAGGSVGGSASNSGSNAGQLPNSKAQPLGPGEIRRAGEQYRRQQLEQQQQHGRETRQGRQHDLSGATSESYQSNELISFPRLGLSDSLLNQRGAHKE